MTIRTGSLNHPGGCIGYRIEWAGKSVALVYDTEHAGDQLDPNVLALIENCDLMVYDCTYTDDEMKRCFGFGHSTWRHGARLAKAAGVKRFALFHHAPPARTTRWTNASEQHGNCFPRLSQRATVRL